MDLYNEKGFSFPELIATLSIAAILAALAAPNIKSLFADHRLAVTTENLYASIMLARSEAIKRSMPVSLCHAYSKSKQLCADTGNKWNAGWIVFTDKNSNGILDPDDLRIRVYPTTPDSISITWNRGVFLRLNSRGQARDAGTFIVCELALIERDNARTITISLTGRARVTELINCGV